VGGTLNLEDARLVDDVEFAIQTARHVPESGDVVYSRELSFGWASSIRSENRLCLSQGMCLFRPHAHVLVRYFIIVLNGPIGRQQAEAAAIGSAHPHINLGDIKCFRVPLPPTSEQQRIIAEVERRLSVIEELETVVKANRQRASRLRQSILQGVFSER
jgi:type I restriction enzyme S subunit